MGLTGKQSAFVAEVVAGSSLTGAYRAAYDADGMSDESVRVEACRLARHPNVSLAIDDGRRAALEGAAWDRKRAITRMQTVNDLALAELVEGSRKPADVSLFMSSWDRLCKLHGLDKHDSDASQALHDALDFTVVI